MKTNPPTHEAIARRAHEIWNAQGSPSGGELDHWLEAERELIAAAHGAPAHADAHAPSPDEAAARIELQKTAARAPQLQHGKNAPRPAPPESGKPVWAKPHSS